MVLTAALGERVAGILGAIPLDQLVHMLVTVLQTTLPTSCFAT
ncbi:MAG: hypothetical protein ACJAYX_004898 [Planctomycetota bacterium]